MDGPRTFECPSCGGELTTDGLTPTIQCPYCGQTVTVPGDLRVKPPAPPPPAESPLVPLIKAAEEVAQEERAERLQQERDRRPARRRGGGCGCGSLLFAIGLILVVLIGGAIYTGNGDVLLSVLNAASGATPTPKPISKSLNAALPRSTRYAGVVFTITGGELTNADPNASNDARYRSDRLYAILPVKLDNTQGDRDVALSSDLVRLQLSDGNQYQNDGRFSIEVAGAATRSGQLVFGVPSTASWTGAKLILRESGKEPAVLPLDGKAPGVPGPLDLKLSTEKTVGTVTYRVLRATLDTARNGQQVAQGMRFLRFNLRVVNEGREPGGALVTDRNFRLLVDGDSLAPDDYPSVAIPPQSKVDGSVDFTIPVDAKNVTLQVGDLSGPKAQVTVKLKP